MVGVVGYASKQDQSALDESKVAAWATQVAAGYVVLPHNGAMILGESASAPTRSKREKRASMRARARRSSGSLRAKTAVRLEIVTKSSRSIFI